MEDADGAAGPAVFVKDYAPFEFTLEHVQLAFDLRADGATVRSAITFAAASATGPLRLHGSTDLALQRVTLDGAALAEGAGFSRDAEGGMVVHAPPAGRSFVLETEVALKPQDNTALEGLYLSSGNFCTQARRQRQASARAVRRR